MKTFVHVLFLAVSMQLCGQTYEVGLFGGGLNNIGDVGKTNYIAPSGLAFGGLFKWNISKRYAWRASILYGKFKAEDASSDLPSRRQRDYSMDNNVLEASAGLEFNFLEYNLHKLGPAMTPYLYTGLTYFRYGYYYFDGGELQDINQKDGALAIPMTVGVKARLNTFIIVGAEVGARYTFTDNLDGSNPENSNFESFQFGNILSDDWYVFSGITVTYTFGRKPCTDCFE